MVRHRLQPHPATPPQAVTGVSCQLMRDDQDRWGLTFDVDGPSGALLLPEPKPPLRTDELWKTTCFELFLRRGDEAYVEFNLSPSGQWAAYVFDGYRQGMAELETAAPLIGQPERIDGADRLRVSLDPPGLTARDPWLAGLSAVIEEANGTKSYWALAHPSDKPDFHHPDSFVLELP